MQAEGELFLVAVAANLLRKKDGIVSGSAKDVGYIPGTGILISLPFTTIEAVASNGSISLNGGTVLVRDKIERQIGMMLRRVERALTGDVGRRNPVLLRRAEVSKLNYAKKQLKAANDSLPIGKLTTPRVAGYFEQCAKALDLLFIAKTAFDGFMRRYPAATFFPHPGIL